jgi:hypothetical protein
MSVDVHEVYAELEACRRDVATARYELQFASPDTVVALRERLEQAEAEEQNILARLDQLASKR